MSSRVKSILFGLFALLVGVALIFGGVAEYTKVAELKEKGVVAPATVVDGRVKSGRKGSKTYYLTLSFATPDGVTHTKTDIDVSKSTYDAAESNQPLKVRYSPTNLENVEVEGDGASGYVMLLAGIGVTLFGLVVTALACRKQPAPPSPSEALLNTPQPPSPV